jgi:hypothetical protein
LPINSHEESCGRFYMGPRLQLLSFIKRNQK